MSVSKSLLRGLLCLLLTMVFAFEARPAFAQGTMTEKPPAGGPRRQLATIIYAGLGGAVLGLSTLSFYGRPQDKLANIAIGFAVGVIGGTAAVTYNAATNPDEFYGSAVGYEEYFREKLLGPSTSVSVVVNENFDTSATTISASRVVYSF